MTTSYQRSIYMALLRDKQSAWIQQETQDAYFKNLLKNDSQFSPKFGIERDTNGYFYLSDNLVAYYNLRNGYVTRIKRNWTSKDWECYNSFYAASIKTKEFRVDTPLHRQIININGNDWEYIELISPNGNYGFNFNDEVFKWPELSDGSTPNNSITSNYKDEVENYFSNFVDQASIVLKHAVKISNDHNAGLPINLCRASSRYKDEIGYFWSDIEQDSWTTNKDEALQYYLFIFEGTLNFAKACGVLNLTHINNLLKHAREQWTTI